MTKTKNLSKILMCSFLSVILCLSVVLFAGCSSEAKISQENMVKALNAVKTQIIVSTASSALSTTNINNGEFENLQNPTSTAGVLTPNVAFMGGILKDKDLKIGNNDTFYCYISDATVAPSEIRILFKMDIEVFSDSEFICTMLSLYENTTTGALQLEGAMSVRINYDFDSNILNAFYVERWVDSFETYEYIKFDSNGLKQLKEDSVYFNPLKNEFLQFRNDVLLKESTISERYDATAVFNSIAN